MGGNGGCWVCFRCIVRALPGYPSARILLESFDYHAIMGEFLDTFEFHPRKTIFIFRTASYYFFLLVFVLRA